LDQGTIARLADGAAKNCPVSKVLNAEITLDAKLG
jgi:osmotically inducible protein OsmC